MSKHKNESIYLDDKTRKILAKYIDKSDSTMNNRSAVARKLIQFGDVYMDKSVKQAQ